MAMTGYRLWLITGNLHGAVNAASITLVPKVPTPSSMADYRPISCCNTIYKVFTARLKQVIHLME